MTRNPNPKSIQDNNESPSTTRNHSLTRIQDVVRNQNGIRIQGVIRYPYPTRIEDAIRNPYPIRIEDPLTYNGSTIIWDMLRR